MNKKLLALAVAAALVPAAAMADSGNVKISGTMHMSVDSTDTINAAGNGLGRQWNVSSNTSNIVLEGNEDLGNGLSAVWKVTSIFRGDDNQDGVGATALGDNVSSGAIGNGNTYLGLSSKTAGTAVLGKHDTPFKLLGRSVDLFGDQIGDARNLTSVGGAGWDLRPSNVMAYLSPSFSGFSGVIAHVTNTSSTVRADDKDGSTNNVTADSVLASYNNGPISLGLAWEKHNLSNIPLNDNKDESAYRLAGAYTAGALKVTGLYQKMSDIGGVSASDRKVWGLGAGYAIGNNTLKAQYYRAGDLGSASNTGANMWALGVDHNFSKRTVAYVALARTGNDSGVNTYGVSGGGHGDSTIAGISGAAGLAKGQSVNSFSLGMKHSF
ncbi:MAG: porin [Sulfuricella sp.]|nr:porin [Sulfuricella sp.]